MIIDFKLCNDISKNNLLKAKFNQRLYDPNQFYIHKKLYNLIFLNVNIDLSLKVVEWNIIDSNTQDTYYPFWYNYNGKNNKVACEVIKKFDEFIQELNELHIIKIIKEENKELNKQSNKIAQFEKVSFKQFKKDYMDIYKNDCGNKNKSEDELKSIYDSIKLPLRKTKFSAGHDFLMPINITLPPGEEIVIPTGIRCAMDDNYVMLIFPRSSLGIKKKMILLNTVSVIDSDYYHADNEGHIFVAIKNNGVNTLKINKGECFTQAVFTTYGIADDNEVTTVRTGGVGSTNSI